MDGLGPVSAREMVMTFTLRSEGNKCYIGSRSCNYPYKADPDAILVNTVVAGYILEKVNQGQTKMTSIFDIDIKGSVPNFIQNWLVVKRSESIVNL